MMTVEIWPLRPVPASMLDKISSHLLHLPVIVPPHTLCASFRRYSGMLFAMKFIVFAFMIGIAGFMLWLFLQPVCPGGVVVATQAECQKVSGFSVAFCQKAFTSARHLEGNVGGYSNLNDCNKRFPICVEAEGFVGYVPKAESVCVRKESSGEPFVDIYY